MDHTGMVHAGGPLWSYAVVVQKTCRGCGQTKDISQFSPKGNGRWHPRCKPCRSAERRAQRAGRKAEQPPENVVMLKPRQPRGRPPEPWPSAPPTDIGEISDSDLQAELLRRKHEFLDAPNQLQASIEQEIPDVLNRAHGLLSTMRLVGPRWVEGNASSAEISAYKDAQKQVVELFETRRKEMSNRDVGHELLADWQSYRSTPVVVSE